VVTEDHWVIDLLRLSVVPLLVLLNGLFVAAEFALVAVRKTRVEEMVRSGLKRAKAAEAAIDRLDRSIAATQLGITLASLALGWVAEPALAHLLEPLFGFLPGSWTAAAGHTAAVAVAFLLITFLHVTFGELIPKNVALQATECTVLWLSAPLIVFARLTRPLTLLMSITANAVLRLFGFQPAQGEESVHSVEELLLLIEDTEEAGVLDPETADYVENVFRLSGKKVKDCMIPVEKMMALELNTPPEGVLEAVRKGAHTRMPVYEGTIDNIVGIVNTKNLFFLFSLKGVVVLEDALYPPLYLSPDESLATALRLFKRSRRPMALVRDEAGKIHGMLTLEDVLEEIIGDIEDEHDRPMPKAKVVPRLKRVLPRTAAPPVAKPPAGKPAR
jgi:CBS domain containing-hemolysin-like protein